MEVCIGGTSSVVNMSIQYSVFSIDYHINIYSLCKPNLSPLEVQDSRPTNNLSPSALPKQKINK